MLTSVLCDGFQLYCTFLKTGKFIYYYSYDYKKDLDLLSVSDDTQLLEKLRTRQDGKIGSDGGLFQCTLTYFLFSSSATVESPTTSSSLLVEVEASMIVYYSYWLQLDNRSYLLLRSPKQFL